MWLYFWKIWKFDICYGLNSSEVDITEQHLWRQATSQHWFRLSSSHDDVIKLKHFPRYRPFVRGIHRSPVDSPYKGQWRRALIFSLICTWPNSITFSIFSHNCLCFDQYHAHPRPISDKHCMIVGANRKALIFGILVLFWGCGIAKVNKQYRFGR